MQMIIPYIDEESSSALRNYIDSLMDIWFIQQKDKSDAEIPYQMWKHTRDRMIATECTKE